MTLIYNLNLLPTKYQFMIKHNKLYNLSIEISAMTKILRFNKDNNRPYMIYTII